MDPTITARCTEAIASAFGTSLEFNPTSSADTAFSGSAVIEVEITSPEADESNPNSKVVLKHSDVRVKNLPPDCGKERREKTEKTDKSSVNECVFLQEYAQDLESLEILIPSTLYTRNHPTEGVTLLMSSLSSWTQVPLVPLGDETTETLRWIAKFHAAFLAMNPDALPLGKLSEGGGWDAGTHLCVSKRPDGEIDSLEKQLAFFASRFSSHDPYFNSPAAMSQPSRIAKVARLAESSLEPENHPHRTMVHGDFKSGNFFYDPSVKPTRISVIDWQWTGPGVGATDLIYLCVMALSDEACSDYQSHVLKPYHSFLLSSLPPSSPPYPYSSLLSEFKIAAIDFQRWLGTSRTPTMTPTSLKQSAENVDVNHGIWRRSLDRIAWLWRLVDTTLDEIDSGALVL
mmetsp:Transcript_18950/g.39445  ORF Transcript_18950/g.39445 Transcript_18950/m.39445 type:complete len:401 (-) Transcript_18950:20-1222(-)